MTNNVNYTHIMTTVVLTSFVFILIWVVSGLSISPYSTYKISTQESVSGLVVDAPVEYKGVEVGKVKSIELKNTKWVEILLSIKKGIQITQGTEAVLTTKGLTTRGFIGFVYITLQDKGTDSRPLIAQAGQPYPVIPTIASSNLSLDATFVQTNKYLRQITELFQSVLDKGTIISIKDLLHNMKEVSKILATHTQRLDSLLINMEKASHKFEPFLTSGQNTMVMLENELKPFLKSALHTMTILEHKLEPFLTSTQQVMVRLESQFLPQTQRNLSTLDEVSHSLLNLTQEIKKDPSILIRGTTPPPPGPGESNENE